MVNFCKRCGTLLETPSGDEVVCVCCGSKYCYGDLNFRAYEKVTVNRTRPRQDWVRLATRTAKEEADEEDEQMDISQQHRATVDESCPECGHGKASFYTVQLRSVDEGQTVFYECLKCSHKWNQNN